MSIAALLALVAVLAACSAPAQRGDDGLVVITTFTVVADMAQVVAGDRARVESLTRVGVEVHGYQPTASDVIRASQADLVLHHGFGLEAWFADFMERVDAPHVTITEGITPIPIEGTDASNPHAWMSTANGALYVEAIRDALTDLDPDGAEVYAANAERYVSQITQIGSELDAALDTIPAHQRVLVTCEGAFAYLAADAGLREVYLWPVNAETQATPRSVAAAIEAVRETQVPAVFCESTVSADTMMQVVREAPTAFGGTLYVDSLTGPDGPAPAYLEMLRHNVRTIAEALTGEGP